MYLWSSRAERICRVVRRALNSRPHAAPNDWNTEIWNETNLQWQNGQLVPVWNFATDWKPVPNDNSLGGWEPLFQPALAGHYIYVPGAGGTLYRLNQSDGTVLSQINPFGGSVDPTKFVAGGLTADAAISITTRYN